MNPHAFIIIASVIATGCVGEPILARPRDGAADTLFADDGTDAADSSEEHENEGKDAGISLKVEGDFSASARTSNAQGESEFETRFSLRLSRGDENVSGAIVSVSSRGGAVTLVESGGAYVGSQSGYFRAYVLTISAAAEHIESAAVVGPAIHVFDAPRTDEHHPAGTPLVVAWSPAGANSAAIETDDYPETPMADRGSFTVPGTAFAADPGRIEQDRVRVRRSVEVPVPGATAGSSIRIDVRNEVRFYVDGP